MTRNQLIKKLNIKSGGTLSKVTFELEQSGFITKVIPYSGKVNGTFYKLTDPYTIFYWKFMISKGKRLKDNWTKASSSQSWKAWSGFAFERLCFTHSDTIKHALGLAAIQADVSSWSNDEAQIDMLVSRADHIVHVCEIKFANSDYEITSQYAKNLRNKLSVFNANKSNKKTGPVLNNDYYLWSKNKQTLAGIGTK